MLEQKGRKDLSDESIASCWSADSSLTRRFFSLFFSLSSRRKNGINVRPGSNLSHTQQRRGGSLQVSVEEKMRHRQEGSLVLSQRFGAQRTTLQENVTFSSGLGRKTKSSTFYINNWFKFQKKHKERDDKQKTKSAPLFLL